jgi:membrane protease YdiL (CAAX protease family)
LAEAVFGILVGFLLATLAVSAYSALTPHGQHTSQFGEEVVSLFGLWVGFVGDYGLVLRPWPDIPLGIIAGVASQYVMVPVVEAPLLPFVHNLYTRLGHPAQSLTGHAHGPGLVLLAVLVCVGSPVIEELFFRGLLLRALFGKMRELGPRLGPAVSIGLTALVFALAHFEALQFLGLLGFGIVLGLLAWRTGRLGPSIVAHMAFNTVTIIAIVATR